MSTKIGFPQWEGGFTAHEGVDALSRHAAPKSDKRLVNVFTVFRVHAEGGTNCWEKASDGDML